MASQATPTLPQGIAPIFCEAPCCFIAGGAHIRLPRASFGSDFFDGFSFGLDIQPEGTAPYFLMGTGVSGKTSVIVHYNEGGVKHRIRCDIQDDCGRMLSARARLSNFAAKRLFICVNVKSNDVAFYEFNLHSSGEVLPVEYLARDSPNRFSEFTYDMTVGGACIDGTISGSMSTKLNNVLAFARPLSEREINELFKLSRQDLEGFYGIHAYAVEESLERRFVFRDDLARVKHLLMKRMLPGQDTRDGANIVYRWLFDTHPLLQDLCNELGIQLTFPGMSGERRERYRSGLMKDVVFGAKMTLGKRSILGYRWVPLHTFAEDPILIIKGTIINNKAFVKFIQQKAGGKHFDPYERRKWQRELSSGLTPTLGTLG